MKYSVKKAVAAVLSLAVLGTALSAANMLSSAYDLSSGKYAATTYTGYNSIVNQTITFPIAQEAVQQANFSYYYFADKINNIQIVESRDLRAPSHATTLYPLTGAIAYTSNKYFPAEMPNYGLMLKNASEAAEYYKRLGFTFSYTGSQITPGVTDPSFSDTSNVTNRKTLYLCYTPDKHDGSRFGFVADDSVRSEFGAIFFGNGTEYSLFPGAALDIVAHEYAHLVTQQLLGWGSAVQNSNIETGAIIEAYSDILGELAESEPDWKMGAELYPDNPDAEYCRRNLADPAATKTPVDEEGTLSQTVYYTDYNTFLDAIRDQTIETDGTEPYYTGSTVLSHAAYQMAEGGIPLDDLRQIWFNSLSHYSGIPSKTTFRDTADAVVTAAEAYFIEQYGNGYETYLNIVRGAFEAAHISCRQNHERQGSLNTPNNIQGFVRSQSMYKFRNNYYWATGDVNASTNVKPSASDHSTYLLAGAKVYEDFIRTDWQNEEPYYQCAGFAKKMQVDYYKTNLFTQLTDEETYVPHIGDHLRFRLPSDSTWGHSIFITAVNGSTITFCDCTGGDYNRIRYNQTVTYTRDESGHYVFSLNGMSVVFHFVERPIPVGDINADSAVNETDLNLMRELMNDNVSSENVDVIHRSAAADINADGEINFTDYSLLATMIRNDSVKDSYGYIK